MHDVSIYLVPLIRSLLHKMHHGFRIRKSGGLLLVFLYFRKGIVMWYSQRGRNLSEVSIYGKLLPALTNIIEVEQSYEILVYCRFKHVQEAICDSNQHWTDLTISNLG